MQHLDAIKLNSVRDITTYYRDSIVFENLRFNLVCGL